MRDTLGYTPLRGEYVDIVGVRRRVGPPLGCDQAKLLGCVRIRRDKKNNDFSEGLIISIVI